MDKNTMNKPKTGNKLSTDFRAGRVKKQVFQGMPRVASTDGISCRPPPFFGEIQAISR